MTQYTRREFMGGAGASLASLSYPLPAGHLRWAFDGEDQTPVLVVVYLRGGMDSLNFLVPYGDERYYALRPTLAIQPEKQDGIPGVVPLDDMFGLHPALAPFEPHWTAGHLAAIVNVGSPHSTRSHFDAQDFMEYAAPGLRTIRDGWLNRYLAKQEREGRLRALAMQGLLPRSLRGEFTVLAVPERKVLADEEMLKLFGPLYGGGAGTADEEMQKRADDGDPILQAGHDTFETLAHFRRISESGSAGSGVQYPRDRFADKLKSLARVIRSGEGLEIAGLDVNGWDTHANQGATDGTMAKLMTSLAGGLSAFMTDLGPHLDRTVILVMTEFGRTANENGNSGTDHGHGGMMLLMGGGVQGGKVHGDWAGLADEHLYQGRDLQVSTDFRDVFNEVLREHLRFKAPKDFFPGYRPSRVKDLFA